MQNPDIWFLPCMMSLPQRPNSEGKAWPENRDSHGRIRSLAVQVYSRITAVNVNDRGGCCLKSGRASLHSADFVEISRSVWLWDATLLRGIARHGARN